MIKIFEHTLLEANALSRHEKIAPDHFDSALQKSTTPLSEVDVDALYAWVEEQKGPLNVVLVDVRDAKRRVSAAKPRKPKTGEGEKADASSSDQEEANSAEEEA